MSATQRPEAQRPETLGAAALRNRIVAGVDGSPHVEALDKAIAQRAPGRVVVIRGGTA